MKWKNEDIEFIKTGIVENSLIELATIMNRTPQSIRLKLNKLGISTNIGLKETIICKNCNRKFIDYKTNKRQFCSHTCSATVVNSIRKRKDNVCIKTCLNCGVSFKGNLYCSKDCSNQHRSVSDYTYYLNNQEEHCRENYSPRSFKKFFMEDQDNKCAICSNLPIWNNKDIVFILDHIDGNSSNNMRENLRCICPNCDSQLDTYKSKNKGNGRFSRRKRYLEGKSF